MKTFRNKLVCMVLSLALVTCSSTPAFATRDPGAGGSMGFFDGLDAFGNATGTIGCILNVGSVLVNGDWSDPGSVCLDLVDNLFGTSFAGDPMQDQLDSIYSDVEEIKETTSQIKDTVDYLKENSIYVNQQLSIITGSLKTVNSQLVRQTQMLSDIHKSINQMNAEMTASFNDLTALVNDSTEEIKSAVYMSTAEIQKTTQLNEALSNYINNYSSLYTYENNMLESLSTKQDSYTAFYNAIMKLDNGKEIMEALNKLTLKEDSLSALTSRQQKLLTDTDVTFGGSSHQVLKFHQDFMSDLMKFVTQNVFTLNGSIGNIGDTALAMGDYLTASNKTFNSLTGNKGIGELYYIYQTYDYDVVGGNPVLRESDTVHKNYRDFMDSMISEYMTTAWLAEMAYGYKIAEEASGSNNATTIRQYEQYLNNVHAQMLKVSAYYDYEYKKCISSYDFGGDASGHDQDLVYYGNTASDGVWNVVRKNEVKYPSGLSEKSVKLALGEEFDLHYYYKYAEVSARSDIKWTSSDPAVAAVNSTGKVLGLSRGVARITAEYMGTKDECLISIGDVMAIENSDGVDRYHYFTYRSENGDWVTDDSNYFETASDRGYDYYYGITTYRTDTVELSESMRSASIAATTGMTESNMDAFTWIVAGDDAVQKKDYEISAVSGGWTEIIGYKKNEAAHSYDFIGIPVHSTLDTIIKDNGTDYSEYKKINTKEDLLKLAEDPDGWGMDDKYVLTADIDLEGMEWSPIGYCLGFGTYAETSGFIMSTSSSEDTVTTWSASRPFMGTFDGNGHTISNFKITRIHHLDAVLDEYDAIIESGKTPSPYNHNSGYKLTLAQAGLFGLVYGGTVKDLNVTDVNIDIDTRNGINDEDGNSVKLGDVTVEFADSFAMYAGGMIGANFWDPFGSYFNYYVNKYFEGTSLSDLTITEEQFENIKKDITLPAYLQGYLDQTVADAGSDASAKKEAIETYAKVLAVYGTIEHIKSVEMPCLTGCYANADIKVTNELPSGFAYAGAVAGGSTSEMIACTAFGTSEASAANGACGGLTGLQYHLAGSSIQDCTSNTDVLAKGGVTAGGLLGTSSGTSCVDLHLDLTLTEDAEAAMERLEIVGFVFSITMDTVISISDYSMPDPNAVISGNQALGSVAGDSYAGGLIGYKRSGANDSKMQILKCDFNNATISDFDMDLVYYNSNIAGNYVACDVKSSDIAAGGLIGCAEMHATRSEIEAEESEDTTILYTLGHIDKNYYSGKIDAGASGYAAGLVALANKDYSELKQNISAATDLIGGDGQVSYAINGKDNGMPLVTGSGEAWNVEGALCYNPGFSYTVGNDGTTKGDADTFNAATTYTRILGDDNYLDLSGGLKPDGTNGLDIENGLIPKKLENRYRFPVEAVPHSYHQGDSFVKVTKVYKYTGTGTEVLSGVTSTTPDMTKTGVQTVTLTYGDFTDTYDVYIYPSAGYLKVTTLPTVSKDGSTLSGGGLTLYENGSATGTAVSLAECNVTRTDDDIFIIKYDKYSTAFRPVYIDIYTNDIETNQAVYLGAEYYTPGAAADVSDMIPSTKEVNGVTYYLIGTSQSATFKAQGDSCILSYYSTEKPGDIEKTWEGSGTAADPYVISSDAGWNDLAAYIENGNSTDGLVFRLDADINAEKAIGSDTDTGRFSGTLDGNGHTITFNATAAGNLCAPFISTNNATFKNLHVAGTITTAYKFAAGLVANALGETTVTNCRSSIVINSSIKDDGTHGGFIAKTNNVVQFEGCVFDGELNGSDTTLCAGFLGYDLEPYSTVKNCIFDASAITTKSGTANFVRTTNAADNSYYTFAIGQGRDRGKLARSVTSTGRVLLSFDSGTVYNVSNITAYSTGLMYKDEFYAGSGDKVALTLGDLVSGMKYTVSGGDLEASETGYILTMPDENVVIDCVADESAPDKDAALESQLVYNKIQTLTDPADLTLSDKDAVATVRAEYDALSQTAKDLIPAEGLAKLKDAEAKIAELEGNTKPKVVKGKIYTVSSQRYKVTRVATKTTKGTVTLIKAKNRKSVTVPPTVKLADGRIYKVTKVAAKSFKASKIRTVTVGKNVNKLAAYAFKGSKARKVILKTKLLKKAGVKKCLKGSKVKTVLVKVGTKKANRRTVKAYKKIFTKKITGRKVTVK